jgi:hypothetical protein
MVHRFYDITKHEVNQIEAEISNKSSRMEMIERDRRGREGTFTGIEGITSPPKTQVFS